MAFLSKGKEFVYHHQFLHITRSVLVVAVIVVMVLAYPSHWSEKRVIETINLLSPRGGQEEEWEYNVKVIRE